MCEVKGCEGLDSRPCSGLFVLFCFPFSKSLDVLSTPPFLPMVLTSTLKKAKNLQFSLFRVAGNVEGQNRQV